jgi:molecular chaperone GrpE
MSKKKPVQETQEDIEQSVDDQPGEITADEGVTVEGVTDTGASDPVATLQEQLEEQRDMQLRAMAEAENVRRRAEADIVNSRKFAVESFAKELLPVRDSLELASSVEIDTQRDDVVVKMEEGLQLTLKQLDHVFEKFDIREVEASPGIKPDPALHQAVSLVDSDEVASGEIVSVMQKGYQLHDRLIRPAMVLVAR